MSGLKINYHKSEVITFGGTEQDTQRIANLLNCKVGRLPMKYLGFPISVKNLGMGAFKGLVEKMRKKLQPWKGKNLSSGGRLILTNSSLSSMPTYMMNMFLLPDGTHKQMDTVRSQFFWRGDSEKFKYHMVKWANVSLPKEFGGLGVINTRMMNEALLVKWIWRIHQNSGDDMCCQLLRAKYLKNKPFMLSRGGWGSQFWKGLHKIKHSFNWGAQFMVNNGREVRFWEDVWVLDVPLRIAFPDLFAICLKKSCLVSDCYVDGEWKIEFRRSLNILTLQKWEELVS